jgi:hypothetical protein
MRIIELQECEWIIWLARRRYSDLDKQTRDYESQISQGLWNIGGIENYT